MVSIVGSIGFVGLARFVVGPGHSRVLPATAVIGGIFMVASDIVSRITIPQQILPIGVEMALFGAPGTGGGLSAVSIEARSAASRKRDHR